MHYIDHIERLGACREALWWLCDEGHPDLAAAWAACPRADWLLWLAAHVAAHGSAEHRAVVAAAADCAAEVLDLAPSGEGRPRAAVEAARRWARGEASAEECRTAATYDAAAASASAYAAAAAAAASAASAAYAARAAAYAARAAANAGRTVDLAATVRRHIPNPPFL